MNSSPLRQNGIPGLAVDFGLHYRVLSRARMDRYGFQSQGRIFECNSYLAYLGLIESTQENFTFFIYALYFYL